MLRAPKGGCSCVSYCTPPVAQGAGRPYILSDEVMFSVVT